MRKEYLIVKINNPESKLDFEEIERSLKDGEFYEYELNIPDLVTRRSNT